MARDMEFTLSFLIVHHEWDEMVVVLGEGTQSSHCDQLVEAQYYTKSCFARRACPF